MSICARGKNEGLCTVTRRKGAVMKSASGAGDRTRTGKLVEGGGFSSHCGFHRQPKLFVRWTMPSPWPCRCRRPPSSLYTFPLRGLARRCLGSHPGGSPNLRGFTRPLSQDRCSIFKSAVFTNFTTPARGWADFSRLRVVIDDGHLCVWRGLPVACSRTPHIKSYWCSLQ